MNENDEKDTVNFIFSVHQYIITLKKGKNTKSVYCLVTPIAKGWYLIAANVLISLRGMIKALRNQDNSPYAEN